MSAAGGVGGRAADVSRLRHFGATLVAGFVVVRPPRPGIRQAPWPPRGHLVLGAVLAIAAVACAMVLLDAWSLGSVRGLPAFVVVFFNNFTDLGLSGWFLYPLAFLLMVMAALDSPAMARIDRGVLAAVAVRLGFVFAAIAVPGLFVALIKRVIGRARPFIDGHDSWAYALFSWRPEYASMPSGHTTTAFAAAVAIGAIWPQMRPLMWVYAVLIAVSRVVVIAHHPSDVIAGALVGAIGALLVRNWFASRRLGFAVGSDGGVRRLPGPSWRRIKTVARRLRSA